MIVILEKIKVKLDKRDSNFRNVWVSGWFVEKYISFLPSLIRFTGNKINDIVHLFSAMITENGCYK